MKLRQHSLYFAGLSIRDSLRLLWSSARVALLGNEGPGRKAEQVERLWSQRFSGQDAIVFPSGRSAITAVLWSLDLGVKDEVLVTGYTCGAVPDAVAAAGATPVLLEVDPETFAIDPAKVAARITPRTAVLIVQHTFGIPAPLLELRALAESHELLLLEDACLALGSASGGLKLGAFGDASVFSFELSKTVTAGWGGVVVTRRSGMGERVRKIRDAWGTLPRMEAARRLVQTGLSGMLYRPAAYGLTKYIVALLFKLGLFRRSAVVSADTRSGADAAWAAVLHQMNDLERTLEHSRRLAEQYSRVLQAHGWEMSLPDDPEIRLCRFPVLVEDPDLWVNHFASLGFELGRWFDAPVSPPVDHGELALDIQSAVGAWLGAHMVNLPLHRRVRPADADRLCLLLDKFLTSLPEQERFASRGPLSR